MPFTDDLEAAGRRAAAQPVPPGPDATTMAANAGRQRTRRRAVVGSLAVAGVVALGVPVALSLQNDSSLEIVAAGTGEAAAASPLIDDASDSGEAAGADDPSGADATHEGSTKIDLRYGDEIALSIEVLQGPEATAAAAAAETAADETRDLDGIVVWIDRDGDTSSVAALPEPELFIEVTGPSDQLDELLDAIGSGAWQLPELGEGFDGDVEKFFEEFGMEGFDIEGFGAGQDFGPLFEQFFGEGFDPEQFFQDFDFEGLEGFDGQIPELDQFLEEFLGEDFDPEQFFEAFDFEGLEGLEGLDMQELFEEFDGQLPDLEEFFGAGGFGDFDFGAVDGCFSIRIEGDGEDFSLDVPEGCNG